MADRARSWPIAREGLPFLALAGVPAVAAWALGWTAAGSLFGAVVLFTGWFFRNPPRRVPDGANLVVSPGDGRDRKSTRLNSSHSQISYAVFCLKKKKKKIKNRYRDTTKM